MAMRHIKNTAPAHIPVTISVEKPDGSTLTVELNYGESILVADTGVSTKSVIIQLKKGNLTINEDYPETMVPYEKCVLQNTSTEVINDTYMETETYEPVIDEPVSDEESAVTEPVVEATEPVEEIVQVPVAQLEPEVPVKKAGRPKGSTKKKRGRPKGSTKKKKLRKLKALQNEQQKNAEQTGEQPE